MDKYEKFMSNTNDELNLLVHEIEASGSSDAFIIAYVNDNKDIIRKIAASKKLTDRQSDMFYILRHEVKKAGISDCDEKTIYRALRGIGIHSADRTYVILYLSTYAILTILNNIFYFSGDGNDNAKLGYMLLYFMNIMISCVIVFVSYMFLSESKFRLFMVKK